MNDTTKNIKSNKNRWSLLFMVIIAILVGRLLAITFQNNVISQQPISGDSMSPTILTGQNLLLRRNNKKPKRGEVIVFNAEGVDPTATEKVEYIKRVIAVAGDTVQKRGNKILVNGKTINQKYLQYKSATFMNPQERQQVTTTGKYQQSTGSNGVVKLDDQTKQIKANWSLSDLSSSNGWNDFSRHTTRVPKNCYFVLGDNRSVSNDSRYFGYVPANKIIGVAFAPAWFNINTQHLVNDQYQHYFK